MRWTVSATNYTRARTRELGKETHCDNESPKGHKPPGPLGLAPAEPNVGVNKLQMGQTQSTPPPPARSVVCFKTVQRRNDKNKTNYLETW